jgi:pyruvate/2-oxoglutarate dehydrogenase complex dihydrolipoamide dehydrogenase (E3) component
MTKIQEFDAVVIGGGQGAALARMLSEGGKRVALVEKESLGGACVNHGCTPTKAHIAAAKRAHDARTARPLGVFAEEVRVDLKAVVARSNGIIHQMRQEIAAKLAALSNLTLLCGTARFIADHQLEVMLHDGEVQHITAPQIIIATGTRPQIPNIKGIDEIEWLSSATLLQLEILPSKLLILGGGYIACEFGQMFRRFGSEVVIAQSGPQLLDREDEDVAAAIATLLREENIEVHLNCKVERFEKTHDGFKCHFANGSVTQATHLLLATGQTPNTDQLNLESTGVRTSDEGHIETDEFLGAAPGIWALGDVKGGPAFTHIAYDDARILAGTLLRNEQRSISNRPTPYCVFTDPQLGRIGLTEEEALKAGHKIRVAKLPCTETARGLESGESKGFLKAVVEEESGQILGGAFLCRDGGEMIAVLQMAMATRLPYTALRDGIFAHPTFVESLNNLFVAMDRETIDGCLK